MTPPDAPAGRGDKNTLTDYSYLPTLQGREKEKLWLWIWTGIVILGLVAGSWLSDVNLLVSEEIAAVLIVQKKDPAPPVVATASAAPVAAGASSKDDEKKKAEEAAARNAAVSASKAKVDATTKEYTEAKRLRDGAEKKYKDLKRSDTAKPTDRLKAKENYEKYKGEYKEKYDDYLQAKASLGALEDQGKIEKERQKLEGKRKEMEKARAEWEKAQEASDDGDNRSILSKIIEYSLMLGLWLTTALCIAGGYLVYNVRTSRFYRGEKQRAQVVQALVHVMRMGSDSTARWEKWREERMWGTLSDKGPQGEKKESSEKDRNHLDEVISQLSKAGVGSDAHIDRYFTAQARDMKDEEYNRIAPITLAGAMGPILGFAGTVLGMILAFGQLGAGKMSQDMIGNIATAINVALVTTLMGLMIKGMALMMKTWISNRIDANSLAISMISSEASAIVAKDTASEQVVTDFLD